MAIGEQQHRYDKDSIREIDNWWEIAEELYRVRVDIGTISSFLRFNPGNIRKDMEALLSYRRYLIVKWLDLFSRELGDMSRMKPPHANFPEFYEYFAIERGIIY